MIRRGLLVAAAIYLAAAAVGRRVHGEHYRAYGAHTARFVPATGRLR
jgi:hypothetical protein